MFKRKLRSFGKKVGTFTTFFFPDRYFLVNCYGGKIYLNLKESEMMIRRSLGIYEYWKTKLFFQLVKSNMIVVDVGANKGYFSLLSAKLMSDKGRVLAFEPYPNNGYWLQNSIQANRYSSITLFPFALSNLEGKKKFYVGKYSGSGSFFHSDNTTNKKFFVKCRKLDNVLEENAVDHVDLLKIDVQGADLEVLEGAEETLSQQNLKIVMDIDVAKEKREVLLDYIQSFGFKLFTIGKKPQPITALNNECITEVFASKSGV